MVRDRGLRRDLVERLGERQLRGIVDRSLEQSHRHLRPLRQLAAQIHRPRHQRIGLHHLVHQAQLERRLSRDDSLSHQEVHRPRDAEHLQEQKLPALVGQQAEAQGGAAEPGRRGRDAKVARERQREAGLDGQAVDGGDRELVQAPHRRVQRLGDRAQPLVGADRIGVPGGNVGHEPRRPGELGRPAADVVAGAERAALAREDHDANGIVHLRLEQRLDQVPLDVGRRAVQALRPVERDHGDTRVVQRDLEPPERARSHHDLPVGAARRGATPARHRLPPRRTPGRVDQGEWPDAAAVPRAGISRAPSCPRGAAPRRAGRHRD